MKMMASLLILLIALCASPAQSDTLEAHIVKVSDGDTVTARDSTKSQHKVRLMGIDAPEKAQPFGNRSKQSLSDLAYDQDLTIQWIKKDRYGRLVGKLISNDGKDINLQQIQRGMAWHYKQYQKEQNPEDRRLYAKAEEDAQGKRLGLWMDDQPVTPWEFRRSKSKEY
jgi:endonuclease YncB( thermonuclease family)